MNTNKQLPLPFPANTIRNYHYDPIPLLKKILDPTMKLENSNDNGQGRIYSTAYKYNMYIHFRECTFSLWVWGGVINDLK